MQKNVNKRFPFLKDDKTFFYCVLDTKFSKDEKKPWEVKQKRYRYPKKKGKSPRKVFLKITQQNIVRFLFLFLKEIILNNCLLFGVEKGFKLC